MVNLLDQLPRGTLEQIDSLEPEEVKKETEGGGKYCLVNYAQEVLAKVDTIVNSLEIAYQASRALRQRVLVYRSPFKWPYAIYDKFGNISEEERK